MALKSCTHRGQLGQHRKVHLGRTWRNAAETTHRAGKGMLTCAIKTHYHHCAFGPISHPLLQRMGKSPDDVLMSPGTILFHCQCTSEFESLLTPTATFPRHKAGVCMVRRAQTCHTSRWKVLMSVCVGSKQQLFASRSGFVKASPFATDCGPGVK